MNKKNIDRWWFLLFVLLMVGIHVKAAERGIIKTMYAQINDILFAPDLSLFGHQDLNCYGLTCHRNHDALCAGLEKRKEYVKSRIIPRISWDFFRWHAYGSRAECTRISKDDLSTVTKKNLIFSRLELRENGKIDHYYGTWDNFIAELSPKNAPFLDDQDHLYTLGYGYSWIQKYSNEASVQNIMCYRPTHEIQQHNSREGKILENRYPCALKFLNDNGKYCSIMLIALANFPYLLQSILHSSEKKKITKTKWVIDRYLVKRKYQYNLSGVTLPDNYKDSILQENIVHTYSSFSELPRDLKLALEKRYEEQLHTMLK